MHSVALNDCLLTKVQLFYTSKQIITMQGIAWETVFTMSAFCHRSISLPGRPDLQINLMRGQIIYMAALCLKHKADCHAAPWI